MPEPTRIKIKLNLRLLPVVLVLLIGVALLSSERVWIMLLVSIGGAWLLDFLWARALARGLRLQRELRYGWAQVGDELEERFSLSNRSSLPALWVEILDSSSLPDYQASLATGVQGNSTNTWRMRHRCERRGVFTLGPTTARSGTPFGIYTIELGYAGRAALVVMPAVVALPEIRVAPGGRAMEGRRRASTFERTVSVEGVRDYSIGDPVKTIHWLSVAHHDKLLVRTFASTPAGDWWIWLDLDRNTQAGAGENSTIEHAVILAASLAARGLTAGHAVGLAANARELVWLAPQTGEGQRLQILSALATVEPGPRSLADVLAPARQAIQRSASVIIITAAVEGEWLDTVLECKSGGTMPTVLLLDRAGYGGSGNVDGVTAALAQWDIPYMLITRDLLDRPETRPGREGHWEWSVSATGRAVARSAPDEQVWRTLA